MARPQRPSRPYEHSHRGPAINDRIRARQVFLVDDKNQKVGVVDLIEALRRSHEAGLDLVEVSPDADPPVCRILDFGKYKYELAKKEKANKAKTKTAELKEVRLGRSMKIDPHDVEIRLQQARRFLMEGHKVQIVQNFRGREMQHRDRGDARMKEIIDKLSDIGKVELAPRMAGRRMSMMIAPDKPKIDALARRTKSTSRDPGVAAASETPNSHTSPAPFVPADASSSEASSADASSNVAPARKASTTRSSASKSKSPTRTAEPETAEIPGH